MKRKNNTRETSHLVQSRVKLAAIPACKGGIMASLRFATYLRPWRYDSYRDFEYQGLVSTQPKTRAQKPELWLVKKSGTFHEILCSFRKNLLAGCPLVWKSQQQVDKFCENNPEILKQYPQGVCFLISRCQSDDLYVVQVEQNTNVKRFDPRMATYHVQYAGGVNERNHGVKKELYCFVIPSGWNTSNRKK